jgi:hypothetical protein
MRRHSLKAYLSSAVGQQGAEPEGKFVGSKAFRREFAGLSSVGRRISLWPQAMRPL